MEKEKNTRCSSKDPEFNSQHLHGSSQLSVTPVPWDPMHMKIKMKKKFLKKGQMVVVQAFNLNTQEAEAGRSLWVQGLSGLQSNLQDSQRDTEKPYVGEQKIIN